MKNSLADFFHSTDFRFIQPMSPLPKGYHRINRWLQNRHLYFDILNTKLSGLSKRRKISIQTLCNYPRMSSYAVGVFINEIVRQMPKELAYLNIGVWNGFSLLAGMIDNDDKTCIGVDNFSKWGNPKANFLKRFKSHKSGQHFFYESGYREYLNDQHRQSLGFYFYDGDHAYEHQKQAMELAECFFAKGCIIMVDDVNWEAPRKATHDFIKESSAQYSVLFEGLTHPGKGPLDASAMHPTYWNGILIIQKIN